MNKLINSPKLFCCLMIWLHTGETNGEMGSHGVYSCMTGCQLLSHFDDNFNILGLDNNKLHADSGPCILRRRLLGDGHGAHRQI